ncbi:MAG: DUF3991 and toprim domain-containing protein [Firmicutes bacterium]|nr:toprim domain-containing protein [Alicyclobacillaceae bacterium]MCL6497024.1 DUF3991 and toprim domain-containing protein [Bacillota bacterium]
MAIDWEALKTIPTERLATERYGPPDPLKSSRTTAVWKRTEHGTLLVERSGPKQGRWSFRDAQGNTVLKGPGPIAWCERVLGMSAREAAAYLAERAAAAPVAAPQPAQNVRPQYHPMRDVPLAWPAVRRYLVEARGLPAELVDALRQAGRIRAIRQGPGIPYACFPLTDAQGQEVGASLRCAGTPAQQAQQVAAGYPLKKMAPGSAAKSGFWSPHAPDGARYLLLVEAPVDALAWLAWARAHGVDLAQVAVRATGGRALSEAHWTDRPWAAIYAAFDADEAGRGQATLVAAWGLAHGVPVIRKAPPQGKDWAEAWQREATQARGDQAAASEWEPE